MPFKCGEALERSTSKCLRGIEQTKTENTQKKNEADAPRMKHTSPGENKKTVQLHRKEEMQATISKTADRQFETNKKYKEHSNEFETENKKHKNFVATGGAQRSVATILVTDAWSRCREDQKGSSHGGWARGVGHHDLTDDHSLSLKTRFRATLPMTRSTKTKMLPLMRVPETDLKDGRCLGAPLLRYPASSCLDGDLFCEVASISKCGGG